MEEIKSFVYNQMLDADEWTCHSNTEFFCEVGERLLESGLSIDDVKIMLYDIYKAMYHEIYYKVYKDMEREQLQNYDADQPGF